MKPFKTLTEAEEWMDSNAAGEISVYIEVLNILEAKRYSVPVLLHTAILDHDSPESRCERWNSMHPAGTEVTYHPVIGAPSGIRSKTRSAAYVMSGHTAVIFIQGKPGCVALEAVEPVDTTHPSGTAPDSEKKEL